MADGRPPVVSTYRLQLHAGFGFAAAREQVPRLAALGVTHLYLSPVLQAAPGSMHGYDVVDHTRVSDDLGGPDALRGLADAAHAHGMGMIVDVVPNHVAVPVPEWRNPRLWSVLRDGPGSPHARWFDVDWSAQEGSILLPVLGDRIGRCVRDGAITVDEHDGEPVVRYADHVLPVRPGTAGLALPDLLDAQWYRLAYWRVAAEEVNYRRFFDVDTLAGVRVEDPEVFREMHAVLAGLHRDGVVDGFRIDHPDGLVDPGGYLDRLRELTGGAPVVVEKILEGDEELPERWACDGTTGYEAIQRVTAAFTDPTGSSALDALWRRTGEPEATFAEAAEAGKRDVLAGTLRAEVTRLVELAADVSRSDLMLRDLTRRGIEEALVEVLVAFEVYRAYVTPGEPPGEEATGHVTAAADLARARAPHRGDEIDLVADLALGRLGRDRARDEFCVRFQQTTGPVMAKGVEDTALYRWHRLIALNEVGGDPGTTGAGPDRLHAWAERRARGRAGMTALSTHDTKRSEDVRARLVVIAECTDAWAAAVERWDEASAAMAGDGPVVHPADRYLMWQTLVGAWPIDGDRLVAYMTKALREGKRRSSWTAPDERYEASVETLARTVLADAGMREDLAGFVEGLGPAWRATALGQKLVQLTLPGIADVYQGTEAVVLSLVDPDNRRPVDHAALAARLERLDGGGTPRDLDDEKLLVTSRALRLRRERPEWFSGPGAGHEPLPSGSAHVLGFVRGGQVVTLATRLPATLAREGGWGPARVALPAGGWRDLLTGAGPFEGQVAAGDLLTRLPVALLVREAA